MVNFATKLYSCNYGIENRKAFNAVFGIYITFSI